MRQWAISVFAALLVLIAQVGCTTFVGASRTKAERYHHHPQLRGLQQQQQLRCRRHLVRPSSSCRVYTNSNIIGGAFGFVCWSQHRVRRPRWPLAAPPWGCSGAESCFSMRFPGYRDGIRTRGRDNEVGHEVWRDSFRTCLLLTGRGDFTRGNYSGAASSGAPIGCSPRTCFTTHRSHTQDDAAVCLKVLA